MLTQESKINVELMKKIMAEKKTTLPSLRNQLEEVKVESEKVNRLLTDISTGNITELIKLIYAGVKLVCDKIYVPKRNLKRNTKLGWGTRLEG